MNNKEIKEMEERLEQFIIDRKPKLKGVHFRVVKKTGQIDIFVGRSADEWHFLTVENEREALICLTGIWLGREYS